MRRWKLVLSHAARLLELYLEDLLLVAGGGCLVAAAAMRWGAPTGLASGGAFLIILSILAAKGGKR